MSRAPVATTLVAACLCLPAAARAQIVAPAGRTLFNRTVMIRSFLRIDNFAEGIPGLRVRIITNPYAVVWGAYPNLNLTFVAPLVSVESRDPADEEGRTGAAEGCREQDDNGEYCRNEYCAAHGLSLRPLVA